jgi:V-type H+-transporting ATPase subunit F
VYQPIPAILEIPSKEHPYDMSQDSILMRVGHLIGADGSVAAI